MKLDLGSGARGREGYETVDITDEFGADHVLDLTKPMPFEDGSVEAISSSHFLEHLTDTEVFHLLEECRRVLAPEGELEVVVPDFPELLKNFLDADWGKKWTLNIMTIYGNQQHEGEFHKSGFDADKLIGMLEYVGFKEVKCESVWTHDQPSLRATAVK